MLFRELLIEDGYSNSSIRAYLTSMRHVLNEFHPLPAHKIDLCRLEEWMKGLIEQRIASASYCNVIKYSLIKYIFKVERVNVKELNLPKPMKVQNECKVVNSELIKRLFDAAPCAKHRLIMMMAYGAGLRVCELRELKLDDINLVNCNIQIYGKYQRKMPIAKSLHRELSSYSDINDSHIYLFEGYTPGKPMTERGMQLIPQKATKFLGIRVPVTLGVLRNSFGAHLFEQGVDMSRVSALMGYKHNCGSLKYSHVAKLRPIPLPLDFIL